MEKQYIERGGAAVTGFFKTSQRDNNDIHALVVYKNGGKIIDAAALPYSSRYRRQMYSISKSFTSTAIGIASDAGLLSVDDRICDIFADKMPENPSENLLKMKVHHLLSMNTGHAECVYPRIVNSDDPAAEFLRQEVEFEPGTHFVYNNAATFMLSAIITRVTGMSMLDYLYPRLFKKIGIEPECWLANPNGVNDGACGLFVSAEELARLGLLYLNGGVYNGERILSEAWVRLAQTAHSDNSMNGNPDWTAGYGYQFWCNRREGYRGDGAMGQLCVILPERGIVAAVVGETADMQTELDRLFELIYALEDENDTACSADLDGIYPPRAGGFAPYSRYYRLEENVMGLTGANLEISPSEAVLTLDNGSMREKIIIGNGRWAESDVMIKHFKPQLQACKPAERVERAKFFASGSITDGKISAQIRYINCPHRIELEIWYNDEIFEMRQTCANGNELLYEGAEALHGKKA